MADSVISMPGSGVVKEPRAGGRRRRWSLDRPAFGALLAALDPNHSRASEKYTVLHERLTRFFQWHSVDEAEVLADEVLDRLARRVSTDGGGSDAIKEPEKFATGIARLLLHEYWRRRQRQEEAMLELKYEDAAPGREIEGLAAVLDRCLKELPSAQRELIERYYGTEGQNQIEARKQLADQFKISLNALRNRAMRIRADLEQRARQALQQ